ncbi:MAG TPA: radical SAM family heme chaperone HemW [Treponema sp.]|nr:radical SAM family heme chaperone HemW [Treponema sp.]
MPSLYIHVPVCKKKCDYCDFYSIPLSTLSQSPESITTSITDSLIEEIETRSGTLGVSQWNTVFIGGGTPSLLPPRDLLRLGAAFTAKSEVTIEANPESITDLWLDVCAEAGITRISVGIQTLHTPLLDAVGRRGSAQGNRDALARISRRWKGSFSVDLMCGLPGQTKKMLLEDIEEVSKYPVNHVSLYSLIIEPTTPLAQRIAHSPEPLLPPDEEVLWFSARQTLEERGFRQYEISNFAQPGGESAHNLIYWHMGSYIGVGPSAVGTIQNGDKSIRYTNKRDLAAWLKNPIEQQIVEEISRTDTIIEVLLMGFRLRDGIARKSFKDRFGKDILDYIGITARNWQKKALFFVTEETVGLTREGLPILDRFLSDCLEEINPD